MERSTTSLASNGAPKGISYIEALRMAEEREKYVMSVFNRFDLDGSGTIDMDELLVLLDELGMVSKLKSDPEEFIRDMFVKYDTNFDGVLNWPEFVNLQNACLDDSLGRRKKDVNPKGSRKDGSTVDARKKLAADKAAKKAAEAARIHRANQEMKARIMAQGKGRDPKVLDAEVERQRKETARRRAEAKAAAKAELDAENRALALRRKNVKAVIDDDITDDVTIDADGNTIVGAGRDAAAAASKARQEAESQRLARENAEYREMIANTVAKTDDDITDDVAVDSAGNVVIGAGRDAAAAASKASKEAEAEKLARENAAYRERIASTGAATDNDITDDVRTLEDGSVVLGGGRDAVAAASKARKEAEARKLEDENTAMLQRVSSVGAATVNQLS
jgi:hypothetical protein